MSDITEEMTVEEWLALLGMSEYTDEFVVGGYGDISTVVRLTESDLDIIGVEKRGHRRKLIIAALELRTTWIEVRKQLNLDPEDWEQDFVVPVQDAERNDALQRSKEREAEEEAGWKPKGEILDSHKEGRLLRTARIRKLKFKGNSSSTNLASESAQEQKPISPRQSAPASTRSPASGSPSTPLLRRGSESAGARSTQDVFEQRRQKQEELRQAGQVEAPPLSTNAAGKQLTNITVIVKAADGIPAADRGGTSDPYVCLGLGAHELKGKLKPNPKGFQHKTKVIKKTLSPVWNASFDLQHFRQRFIDFFLFDYDRFSKDDFLCWAQVPVERLFREGTVEEWVTLHAAEDPSKNAGTLWLNIKYGDGTPRKLREGEFDMPMTDRPPSSSIGPYHTTVPAGGFPSPVVGSATNSPALPKADAPTWSNAPQQTWGGN